MIFNPNDFCIVKIYIYIYTHYTIVLLYIQSKFNYKVGWLLQAMGNESICEEFELRDSVGVETGC